MASVPGGQYGGGERWDGGIGGRGGLEPSE